MLFLKGRISGQPQFRVFLKHPVQLVKKMEAVLRVVLPGILAVQNHRDHRVLVFSGDVFHVMHQVANRVPGVPVGIGKTNQIR